MGSKPRGTGDGTRVANETAAVTIKRGDRRASLAALRDVLADSLVEAEPNVVAQIAGRLQAVLSEIDQLPSEKKVSKADELAGRRKARRAAAAATARPAGEGQ